MRSVVLGVWLIGGAVALAGAPGEGSPSAEVAPAAGGRDGCRLPFVERATAKSSECMTCHDGSNPAAFEVRHEVSHRMDFDYAALRAASQDPNLAPAPPLVLPDGRVTCTTCHDAKPALKGWIALPNKELCLSCHRMD